MWGILVLLSLVFITEAAATDDEEGLESHEMGSSTKEEAEEEGEEEDDEPSKEPPNSREDHVNEKMDADAEASRKKVKKKQNYLLETVMAGMLIKSALLPLAVGFLKLLTAKALTLTLMALILASVLTFRSATEHKGSTTEVIDLTGPHGQHRSLPQNLPEILAMLVTMKWP